MNWKKRYEEKIVTDISEVSIGDLLSWSWKNKENDIRSFWVVDEILDNEAWGKFNSTKSSALDFSGSKGFLTIDDPEVIITRYGK